MKTRKGFYRALKKVAKNFNWSLSYGGIRAYGSSVQNGAYSFCPITSVAKLRRDPEGKTCIAVSDARTVGREMGLSDQDVDLIMDAADNEFSELDATRKRIRRALFRATGLVS